MASFGRNRPRRTWPQRFGLLCGIVLVFASAGIAAGLGFGESKLSELPRVALGGVLAGDDIPAMGSGDNGGGDGSGDGGGSTVPLPAENYLLVGIDNADDLDSDDPARAGRSQGSLLSDTIIVLRVEPQTNTAALLSIPRDLWVPIGGDGGFRQKINSALAIGGPEGLVATITDYFDIPIHHYVQVDFAGFREIVDALDGVPLWFENPVRDIAKVDFEISEPGCHVLDGEEALKFARSRSLQTLVDGRWETDGTGDLGRIDRQQRFLVAALKRAVAKGGLTNPSTTLDLVNAGIASVTLDELITPRDLLDLANRFSSFEPEALEKFTVPAYPDWAGEAAILRLLDSEAQPILDRFRGASGTEADPESVRLVVLNGTGEQLLATTVSDEFAEHGFVIAGRADAAFLDPDSRTVISHAPGEAAAADLVARWLVADDVRIEEDPGIVGSDVVVLVGGDHEGLRAIPREPTPTPEPTPTVTPTPGGGDGAPGPTTTTTVDPRQIACEG
ncbi:MAG: LCP family protein [Acidimicrobiales bacterium]